MNFDLAIIGGGAAGMTAAVIAAENGLRTAVTSITNSSEKSSPSRVKADATLPTTAITKIS